MLIVGHFEFDKVTKIRGSSPPPPPRVSPRKMRKHHGNWRFGLSAARVDWGPEAYPCLSFVY